MNILFKFNNGDVLKDSVTGFTGVVMVCAIYSTGCHHYGLLSQELVKGKEGDWNWLDQSRLSLVDKQVVDFIIDPNTTSGSMPVGPK